VGSLTLSDRQTKADGHLTDSWPRKLGKNGGNRQFIDVNDSPCFDGPCSSNEFLFLLLIK